MTAEIARCQKCEAEFRWLLHVRTERPAPIDVTPPAGVRPNVCLVGSSKYKLVGGGDGTTTSHFATCPAAASFRRGVKRP